MMKITRGANALNRIRDTSYHKCMTKPPKGANGLNGFHDTRLQTS